MTIHFPKPPRFDHSFWCRIIGHRWYECSDGWYCWRGSHGLRDEDRMKLHLPSEPETIFIIRDNMEWVDVDFHNYIQSLPKEIIAKKMRWRVELIDGTRIIAFTRARAEQGIRGYSNVRYA